MLIEDHINLQGGSPLAFKNVSEFGERFVDMCDPYDKDMGGLIEEIATEHSISLQKGVYVAVVGPQLETKAEYRMLKTLGADAVGMSTVPEVIVANHLRLPIVAVSVLTDECDPDNLEPININEIQLTFFYQWWTMVLFWNSVPGMCLYNCGGWDCTWSEKRHRIH